MRTYKGNEMAPAGLYWNRREWTLNIVKGPADRLPGDDTGQFWRLPAAALLLVAPVMGLGFILFLPLAGFLLLGELILEKAGPLVQSVIRHAHVPRRARPGAPPVR